MASAKGGALLLGLGPPGKGDPMADDDAADDQAMLEQSMADLLAAIEKKDPKAMAAAWSSCPCPSMSESPED